MRVTLFWQWHRAIRFGLMMATCAVVMRKPGAREYERKMWQHSEAREMQVADVAVCLDVSIGLGSEGRQWEAVIRSGRLEVFGARGLRMRSDRVHRGDGATPKSYPKASPSRRALTPLGPL